jgi:hypothetical protein
VSSSVEPDTPLVPRGPSRPSVGVFTLPETNGIPPPYATARELDFRIRKVVERVHDLHRSLPGHPKHLCELGHSDQMVSHGRRIPTEP